eukprot:111554-Amorphochlora_amoeboformis.AAC.1
MVDAYRCTQLMPHYHPGFRVVYDDIHTEIPTLSLSLNKTKTNKSNESNESEKSNKVVMVREPAPGHAASPHGQQGYSFAESQSKTR